jgi:hypothetical protein
MMVIGDPQVNVLGFGVRDSVPPTADGGPFQEALQHVRLAGGVHRGLGGAPVGGREDAGAARPHPLPRVGRRERGAAVPLQDHGHGDVAVHAGLHILAFCVSTR